MEVVGYETYDIGLALEALVAGFWIDGLLSVCRTGEYLKLPVQRAGYMKGDGFFWYDTGQEHIVTDSTFRNCGFRSSQYDQYDTSPTRGCNSNPFSGCHSSSTVFGFLTHSDQFTPELMQATRNITMDDVGRRFLLTETRVSSVSGLTQNWYDYDGSVSGLFEPTLMGSGLEGAGLWWKVDDNVFHDEHGPLELIKKNDGPARGLAHIRLEWDSALHSTVGNGACVNGRQFINNVDQGPACNAVGRIRHIGPKFGSSNDAVGGLPVTANPTIVGVSGGYGWLLTLNGGAPRTLKVMEVESEPESPVTLSIAYPLNTTFTITAKAAWCYSSNSCTKTCQEVFMPVDTVDEVRSSIGNVYHYDVKTGVLTVRVTMFPERFTGEPLWTLWNFNDVSRNGGGYALRRFERDGVLLPTAAYSAAYLEIAASCAGSGVYCDAIPLPDVEPSVCDTGFEQVSYDKCCEIANPGNCVFAYVPPPSDTPAPSQSPTATNPDILENGDFEDYGFCPWKGQNLQLEDNDVKSGLRSVKTSGRTGTWQGVEQNVFGKLEVGARYNFSAWVKILNAPTDANNLYVKIKVLKVVDRVTSWTYPSVYINYGGFPNATWTYVSSTYTFSPTYEFIDAVLYFEGPAVGVDFLVDAVSMIPI
jgi:hypothetical protein